MIARVAGSDTREALATPTVRAASMGALLGAGPGIAVIFTTATSWSKVLDFRGTGAWLTPLLLVCGVAAAITTWRAGVPAARVARPLAIMLDPAFVLAAFFAMIAISGDARLAAVAMPSTVLVAGNAIGRAALYSLRGCVRGIEPAASGIVVAAALGGIVPGAHIMMVHAGSGVVRATGWSAAYLALAGIALMRARRAMPVDRRRIELRERVAAGVSAQMPDAALACRSITVRFGPNVILQDATMEVAPGELVALIGANGAGKSTLLKVAAGFVPIETGQVTVANEDVTTLMPEERAAAGLSFVSGARPIFPDLTVMQNLRAAAYRTHKTPRAFEEAAQALLELVPTLADRRERRAGVLSGGEQRLLAVAQTMFRRPAVLLADELTLGLDHDSRLAVMDLLQGLAKQGVAVVAVDHDLPSLLPRSNRVALVADRAITMHDDPLDILRRRTDLLPATFLAGVEG